MLNLNLIQLFLSGGAATRTCSAEGVWSDIDFSGCTLPSGTNPGLLLWIPLLVPRAVVQNSSQAIIQDVRMTSRGSYRGEIIH